METVYRVITASNGEEAVALADDSFSLIVLDVNMPERSGFSACSEIRKKTMAPILFLTARTQESDKAIGFLAGGDDSRLRLYAQRAYDQANRMKEMSDSLFNSCISDSGQAGTLERVDGRIFFRNALSDAESYLEDYGFKVCLVPLLDDYVFDLLVDHSKMLRLFENIISNIRKYADPRLPVCV